MSFKDEIEERAARSFWDAHLILDAYSRSGDPNAARDTDGHLTVEQAALRVIAMCARDTYRLKPETLSNFELDPFEEQTVRIAGIALGRHDIGLHANHPKCGRDDRTKTLRLSENNGFVFSIVNRNGQPQFDRAKWENERLCYLDRCLEEKANIICLGEFDFPPQQEGADDAPFVQRIMEKINARDHPVFVLGGSRHEYECERVGSGDGFRVTKCHNVARIFVNDALNTAAASMKQTVFRHEKIVPAAKIGERLTPPDGIEAHYYDTQFGRIAVLICVDSYNPTLMFSLFDPQLHPRQGKREGKSDRLDFILVPAYNFSPKLYYACQVLSMLCRSTVLLVDACCHWSENRDLTCREMEIFVNGRTFDHWFEEGAEIGHAVVEEDKVRIWELYRDFLRAADAQTGRQSPTPSFDAVSMFIGDSLPEG